MKKEIFVEYSRLSKKKKKEYNKKKRTFWSMSPVQKTKKSGKIYDRKRFRNDKYDSEPFLVCLF